MSPASRRRLTSDLWRHTVCVLMVLALGLVLRWALPAGQGKVERALADPARWFLGFAGYGPAYLALTAFAFRGLRGDGLREELLRTRPPRTGWRRWLLASGPRTWAVTVAMMALGSVLTLIVVARTHAAAWLMLSGLACILGVWVLLLAVFATEYARLWAEHGSFRFPDDDDTRSFDDFLYTGVQVSTTFSTSDVEVLGRTARTLVSVHSLTAWLFSTVFLALVVSLVLPG